MYEHAAAPLLTGWPAEAVVRTDRLRLRPIHRSDAEAMAGVLSDPGLYTVTGGSPPSVEELRERYARWERGSSPDGHEGWLNWVVETAGRTDRPGPDAADVEHAGGPEPVGWLQATAAVAEGRIRVSLAWVVGTGHQGRGYAAEGVQGLVGWLAGRGVTEVRATIREGHAASERVAERAGLTATGELVDGERVWARELR